MGLLPISLLLSCNNLCPVCYQSLTQLVGSILLDSLLIVVVLADLPVVLAALVVPVLADLVVVLADLLVAEVLADLFLLRLLPLLMLLGFACLARLPV
jgi:hypothetical protein